MFMNTIQLKIRSKWCHFYGASVPQPSDERVDDTRGRSNTMKNVDLKVEILHFLMLISFFIVCGMILVHN